MTVAEIIFFPIIIFGYSTEYWMYILNPLTYDVGTYMHSIDEISNNKYQTVIIEKFRDLASILKSSTFHVSFFPIKNELSL